MTSKSDLQRDLTYTQRTLKELDGYIARLKSEGRNDLVKRLEARRPKINRRITVLKNDIETINKADRNAQAAYSA